MENITIHKLLGKKNQLALQIEAIDQVLKMFGYNGEKLIEDILEFDLPIKTDTIEDKLISKTGMSIRLTNLLKYCGCEFVKDILKFSESDLLKRRGFGKTSIDELKLFLKNNNLKLKK